MDGADLSAQSWAHEFMSFMVCLCCGDRVLVAKTCTVVLNGRTYRHKQFEIPEVCAIQDTLPPAQDGLTHALLEKHGSQSVVR